ncbi:MULTISPECIES: hypothetical protein [unclassified Sphingomonas]|uniref:hypothetical protein n=1 Tax=unclassified Sphingomonas TaxID=196159 RepID=UPI0006FC06E9|nr:MULTISPECIES: hypothetical protein [unclassified Sphingomonas]KQM24854.1 hypothetical protein ASE58_15810 [Sphingomonas sp. Leaf9]KQM42512.1 hypothetical protein ASE57_15810 [Sphingomonas sp. Leaf11]
MIAAVERADAMAARWADAVRERVVAAAREVPGVAAEVVGDGVVLSGRGLVRRTISDPRLQDVAGWGR